MTTAQALAILDTMTQPQSVGKASRTDYANTEAALQHLRAELERLAVLDAKPKRKK